VTPLVTECCTTLPISAGKLGVAAVLVSAGLQIAPDSALAWDLTVEKSSTTGKFVKIADLSPRGDFLARTAAPELNWPETAGTQKPNEVALLAADNKSSVAEWSPTKKTAIAVMTGVTTAFAVGAIGADASIMLGALLVSSTGAGLVEWGLTASVTTRTAQVSRVAPAAVSSSAPNKFDVAVGKNAAPGADKAATTMKSSTETSGTKSSAGDAAGKSTTTRTSPQSQQGQAGADSPKVPGANAIGQAPITGSPGVANNPAGPQVGDAAKKAGVIEEAKVAKKGEMAEVAKESKVAVVNTAAADTAAGGMTLKQVLGSVMVSLALVWGGKQLSDKGDQGGDYLGGTAPPTVPKTTAANIANAQAANKSNPVASKEQVPQIMKVAPPPSIGTPEDVSAEALLSSIGSMEAGSLANAEKVADAAANKANEKSTGSDQSNVFFEI